MMEFKYQHQKDAPKTTVQVHSEATLDEVLESFECFLRACTYAFKGHLEIVEDKEDKKNGKN